MVNVHDERLAPRTIRRISWAAIFAGLAVALMLQLLFDLLGLGIGASTVHPTSASGASAQSVGTGSAVWFIVASLLSLFAGGWVAGRVAGIPHRLDGALHGIVTWSLTSLLTVYLLTTALGGLLGGTVGALGSVLGAAGNAAGSGIAAVAPQAAKAAQDQAEMNGITPESMTSQIEQTLNETENPKLNSRNLKREAKHQQNLARNEASETAQTPQDAKQNYNDLVYRFLHDSGLASRTEDRQSLINVVAARQHVSKTQAAKTVDNWSEQAQQAQAQAKKISDQVQQQAKEAGDAAAAAVSKAAVSAFFLFLLSGIAAGVGGLVSIRSIMAEGQPVTVVDRRPL